jgi:MFS family permease
VYVCGFVYIFPPVLPNYEGLAKKLPGPIVCLFVCLFIYLSVFVCLFVSLFIYLSVCLFVCLVCLFLSVSLVCHYLLSCVQSYLTTTIFPFFQAQCARDFGIPTYQTKWLNIVFGFGCFFGKLVSGSLAEPLLRRDMCKNLYLVTLFAYSLSSLLVSFNPVFEYLVAYMVFVGFLQGLVESLFFLVNLEIAGKNGYRAACGFTLALTSVSMTTGPPLAGEEVTP